MDISDFLGHFRGVRYYGNDQYSALCPCPDHNDTNASLSINRGFNENILLYCHAGCKYADILSAVGLTRKDVIPEESYSTVTTNSSFWKIVAEYQYTETLKKIRWLKPDGKKTFSWKHKKSQNDTNWHKSTNGQSIPLYNQSTLASVNENATVYVVEGEKDVDLLTSLDRAAVCSPHGATKGNPKGKWLQDYSVALQDFNVVIIPDNDEVGKTYAQTVASSLYGYAKSIKIVDLALKWSDLKDGGDISDIVEMTGNGSMVMNDLYELRIMTPEYCPDNNPIKSKATNSDYTYFDSSDLISARDLQLANLPPIKYIIHKFLPVGLTIFSAASKIGKSWLVLHMGLMIALGQKFWDKQTERSAVLYLALEDTDIRLRDRINKVLNYESAPENFYYQTHAPNLDCGLIDVLDDWLQKHPDIKLIIVDTLQKIRGRSSSGLSMYQQDYKDMSILKKFAKDNDMSLFLVHHNRKIADNADPYNMISGSNGIMGAADTIYVITKGSRSAEVATLHLIGRDIEQDSLLIRHNKTTFHWELVGEANIFEAQRAKQEYDENLVVKTIKALLNETSDRKWSGTATKLNESGKRITGSFIAETSQKLGYELKSLDEQLYRYDKICYEPKKNGNAGNIHNFYYLEDVEPVVDTAAFKDDEADSSNSNSNNDFNSFNDSDSTNTNSKKTNDDIIDIETKKMAERLRRQSELIEKVLGLE